MSLRTTIAAAALSLAAMGAAHAAETHVKLDRADVNVSDNISLQSGARTFANYCLNCHSATAVRWNTLTRIGLTEDQILQNLAFGATKIGETMTIAYPPKEAKAGFGVTPPDLSVIARSRGADWLYTYLRGFYRDSSTQTGWNNTVYPNVGMPHVLWQLQGERVLTHVPVTRDGKPVVKHVSVVRDGKKVTEDVPVMDSKFEYISQGTMSPMEYDRTVHDLVNFLVWIGEPHQVARKNLGVWVLFALLVLIALTYALKKNYWQDVH